MVEIYTKVSCPFCTRAIALLNQKNVAFKEYKIDTNRELRQEMIERTSGYTVPQILIDNKPIGGCDDLYALENAGKLDALLHK
ncbi:glutaredoxin 3 [Thiotrichales bacterium 19S3-7]|nr:glutaredoxin 3 [Thiotrichales bacterium 19S3-7]MCF6802596.1 glutaredoxin 3 [Thiotrichales bacterium 19S3-11]